MTICTLYKALVRPHLEYGNATFIRKIDRIDSEKSDEVNQPIERQNLGGKLTRTRTFVTGLQAKGRRHDFNVQDYERTRKDGHKRPIFTVKTRTYRRSHSESLQKSCRESCKG